MILLLPLFIIIAICIKIDSHGPVFFKHKRNGKNGKEFLLIKFRSMYDKKDVLNNTERTKVGAFISKYYLDELPQLINVLKGEMTFIGPRPWVVECYEYFTDRQKIRFEVKPGITGLAQVTGGKTICLKERIEKDIEYVKNVSLSLDIKIFFKTIKEVFFDKNKQVESFSLLDEIEELKNKKRLIINI